VPDVKAMMRHIEAPVVAKPPAFDVILEYRFSRFFRDLRPQARQEWRALGLDHPDPMSNKIRQNIALSMNTNPRRAPSSP